MNYFDLHCDTLTLCYEDDSSLKSNSYSVDLNRLSMFDRYVQTFAIFIPDHMRGVDASYYYRENVSFLKSQVSENYILSVEGGSVLDSSLEEISVLEQDGVRMLTLTWNGENELGYGCHVNKGLKPFGKSVVQMLDNSSITIDVSHLPRKAFWEVMDISTKPVFATHSNSFSIFPHVRNLNDDQITEINRRKGLIGLCLCSHFLGSTSDDPFDSFERHLYHMLELGCAKTVAIGSDFDGAPVPKQISSVSHIPALYEHLLNRNFQQSLVEDLFWNNAYKKLML